MIALYIGAYEYYSDSEDWLLQANAYRWLEGEVALIDMDAAWADLTGSLSEYVRIIDPYSGYFAYRLSTYANDGLLPYYAVEYPGGTRNERILGNIAHTAQTSSPAVASTLVSRMQTDFDISIRPAGSVASVAVSPTSVTVGTGGSTELTATLRDIDGNVLSGKTVSWSSDNTGVASVAGSGVVSGMAEGSTVVRAASEGYSGTATVTVTVGTPLAGVSISGPSELSYGVSTTYTASVSGGTAPLSYTWYVDGYEQQSGPDYTFTWYPERSFQLQVRVTDARGSVVTAERAISVTGSCGTGVICD